MLRCTVAGLIPLMMSEKYTVFSERLYQARKAEFDKIMTSKSYSLLCEMPAGITVKILLPGLPEILSRQKKNGLWPGENSAKVTYDILSVLRYIGMLDGLLAENRLKNPMEVIKGKYDYDSLLIKRLFSQWDERELDAVNKHIQEIRGTQNENGSWENTVVATVHHMETLMNLSVDNDDPALQKGVDFLFDRFNMEWAAQKTNGETYSLRGESVFSGERDLEFEAAQKYRPEWVPRQICYRHLGIMQNAFYLRLFLRLGLERDERVESALDGIFSVFKSYHGLCYFEIQKKRKAKGRPAV